METSKELVSLPRTKEALEYVDFSNVGLYKKEMKTGVVSHFLVDLDLILDDGGNGKNREGRRV